jgi:hypothetical protein
MVNLAVTRITTVRVARTLGRTSSSGSSTRIQPRLPQTVLLFKNVDTPHCVQEVDQQKCLAAEYTPPGSQEI